MNCFIYQSKESESAQFCPLFLFYFTIFGKSSYSSSSSTYLSYLFLEIFFLVFLTLILLVSNRLSSVPSYILSGGLGILFLFIFKLSSSFPFSSFFILSLLYSYFLCLPSLYCYFSSDDMSNLLLFY